MSSKLLASTISLPTVGGTVNQTTQHCADMSGNTLSTWEWNFYTGAVLPDPSASWTSCTLTATTPADRTTSIAYLNGSNYLAKNIVNRPSSVTITNAGGATVAQTLYCYDDNSNGGGCSTPNISGNPANMMNHDDTNFGSGNPYRGNATQIKRLIGGSNYAITLMTYDVTGQRITSTDANFNQTTYSYADNFFNDAGDTSNPNSYTPPQPTNAYLTTLTQPMVNSVALTEKFGYYWGTGQKALSTDPNNQTTYFHFADPLNRATSTKTPNTYNGSCCGWSYRIYPNASETQVDTGVGIQSTSLSINCTGSVGDCRHDQKLTDGLGRVTSSILVSDPDSGGQTTVTTAYDSNGRVYSVSNPHRSTSASTDGTEYYAYDGLDRKIQVTRPDGNIATTAYGTAIGSNGRTSQICSGFGMGYPVLGSDETGKLRQTWTDGFGRLIEVDEPDPTTGSLASGAYAGTCYGYDLNNNLIGVKQPGTESTCTLNGAVYNRCFSYDMTSRLTSATNPESGTISYVFDGNGNVLSKTTPTATLSYCYDALNRLTSKAYTSQSCPMTSPVATYLYDQTSYNGLTTTNGLGRRTGMTDPAGSEAWAYDSIGGVLFDQRTTNSVSKNIPYLYNLDGSVYNVAVPSFATGSHPLNSTYAPGGAQRPLSLSLVSTYGTNIVVLQNLRYTAAGQMCYMQGNWAYLWTTTATFNNRLQPATYYAVRTDYQAPPPVPVPPPPCAASGLIQGTGTGYVINALNLTYNYADANGHNNGNVMSITNVVDSTRTQNFTYDSLNRLSTAQTASTYSTSHANCWAETYTYDVVGNLKSVAAPSGTYPTNPYGGCVQESGFTNAMTGNNQISGFCYDASGNLLKQSAAPCPSPTYVYNAENQLTSTVGVTYTYDGDGKRVMKSSGTIYWYGTNSDPLMETDLSNNLQTAYLFLNGKRAGRYLSTGEVDFYFADSLGSSRYVFSLAGGNDSDFYPFGGERVISTGTLNHYKFTGKERDSESGLDNFGARYDSSQYGRFMTPDDIGPGQHPEDPQTWNMYSYVRNNPLNLTDPMGQYTCDGTMTQTQCDYFQKGLDKAQDAANNLKSQYGVDSDQYKNAQGAIDAYGKENVNNGVSIGQGNTGNYAASLQIGPSGPTTSDNPSGQNIHLTFNSSDNFFGNSNGNNGADLNGMAALEAHEGSHVADASAWVKSGFSPLMNPTTYQSEMKAYLVGNRITEGLGFDYSTVTIGSNTYRTWQRGWDAGQTYGAVNNMIRAEYPQANLKAFSINTKIKR
jgi:RHS repeat-associated protein